MLRSIICTTGISISQGVGPFGNFPDAQRYKEAIRNRLAQLAKECDGPHAFLKRASAETNSLCKMAASQRDDVYLLHSETPDGLACALELCGILEKHLQIKAKPRQIEGLQVHDPERFRRDGIQSLFKELNQICSPILEDLQHQVILNATGGFKSVVPYLTLYGLLHRLQIEYIFEQSEALMTLPPAPINFDYERLGQAQDAIEQLRQAGTMAKERFFDLIPGLDYPSRGWYECLLEEDAAGEVTLSAFGMLLCDELLRDEATVWISPRARQQYESSHGAARAQYTFMLERVKNPMWRRSKRHAFHGTDLHVMKPGNTSERMICIVRPSRVYVCELLSHDEYVRVLPSRNASDFSLSDFTQWVLPSTECTPPKTEEDGVRRLEERCVELEAVWRNAEDQADRMRRTLESGRERHSSEILALQSEVEARRKAADDNWRHAQQVEERLKACEECLAKAREPWWSRFLPRSRP